MARFCSFLWLSNIPLCVYMCVFIYRIFIHLSTIHRRLSCVSNHECFKLRCSRHFYEFLRDTVSRLRCAGAGFGYVQRREEEEVLQWGKRTHSSPRICGVCRVSPSPLCIRGICNLRRWQSVPLVVASLLAVMDGHRELDDQYPVKGPRTLGQLIFNPQEDGCNFKKKRQKSPTGDFLSMRAVKLTSFPSA